MALMCMPTEIPDVLLVHPDVFEDQRGFFMETFNAPRYAALGIDRAFVQDNYSHSRRHTLRGLHYQLRHPQAKLVSVVWGTVFDVAVDLRRGSPTFGRWVAQVLSDENRCQLFIPEGFAHGFCVLSDRADVTYKCTEVYRPEDECGLVWNDPTVGIEWAEGDKLLSPKDEALPRLDAIPAARLPRFAIGE